MKLTTVRRTWKRPAIRASIKAVCDTVGIHAARRGSDALDVLAIAPHPDDEVIGAGGALCKHSRAGRPVTTIQVIGRERGKHDDHTRDEDFLDEIRRANKVIGVRECVRLEAPSRDFAVDRALRLAVVSVIRRVRPDVVYVPHGDEIDEEHRQVHHLAVDALWMASSDFFPEAGPPASIPALVLGYEVWTPLRRYQYVEDISETVDAKAEAMRAYASQLSHAPWDEAVRGLAAYRGATALGCGYAEVYEVISLNCSVAGHAHKQG